MTNESGKEITFMASVTGRISQIKQPKGGYIPPSKFETTAISDGITLNPTENVHGSVIGLAVDYLTRFATGTDIIDAFHISLQGAVIAEQLGMKGSTAIAKNLLEGINGLDDNSIVNVCKLVTFDVWLRNPFNAMNTKGYKETNPDRDTIENIQILVKRNMTFLEKYGPVTKDGFTFEPINGTKEDYTNMIQTGKGTFGGYTKTVDSGDGDFLTADTLWDFKVLRSKLTTKHTLQLLMYWIMGQHSGQEIFQCITKLGIFNPRLNTVYLLDLSNVSQDVIRLVEDEVICY